jgi:hypothetical protein
MSAGGVAPAAFLHPSLLIVPAVGLAFSCVGLRQIATSEGLLAGRRLALLGLALSLVCGVGATTKYLTRRQRLATEAQAFVEQWFAYLADDQPLLAVQLMVRPAERLAPSQATIQYYAQNETPRQMARNMVGDAGVASLLFLGHRATVQLYEIERWSRTANGDTLEMVYAVSFDEGQQRKSYFMLLTVSRSPEGWMLNGQRSPYRPRAHKIATAGGGPA